MDSTASLAPRAILFGLDPAVEAELSASLCGASYVVTRSVAVAPGRGPGGVPVGEIVFCSRGAAFSAARTTFPDLPVVIVSRLPDTREWVDALELGAADYVAAPFETVQMRWLLDTHCRRSQAAAAASATQVMHMPKCA